MATKVLDITKEHCPMTFVKTKIELSKLQSGDILEVLLTEASRQRSPQCQGAGV